MSINIRIIALTLFMILNFVVLGQSIIFRGGISISNISSISKSKDYLENTKPYYAVNMSALSNMKITDNVILETGLHLCTRGIKQEVEQMSGIRTVISKNKLLLAYLNIPLNLKITHNFNKTKIYSSFGPYIGSGLIGNKKIQLDSNDLNLPYAKRVIWGNDENTDDLRRLDYGLSIGVGIEFNSIQLGIAYYQGISNISSNRDLKLFNRAFEVFVGGKI